MDYLIEKGFSTEILNKLYQKYDDGIIELLILEKNNVCEVIDYLKSIGIKDISAILIYRIELFFISIDEVKKSFEKKSIPFFVRAINDDITNIDEL